VRVRPYYSQQPMRGMLKRPGKVVQTGNSPEPQLSAPGGLPPAAHVGNA
jgi:hypothetical protein